MGRGCFWGGPWNPAGGSQVVQATGPTVDTAVALDTGSKGIGPVLWSRGHGGWHSDLSAFLLWVVNWDLIFPRFQGTSGIRASQPFVSCRDGSADPATQFLAPGEWRAESGTRCQHSTDLEEISKNVLPFFSCLWR